MVSLLRPITSYCNKHIPEANRLSMTLKWEDFFTYLLYIKLTKLASQKRLNQMTLPL